MSSSGINKLSALLKKTEHYDKDERYMATSDLCEVLKRSTSEGGASSSTLDATSEKRICTAVLRLLHDKSNDVQAIAVKTLGVLLTTVQEEQVLEIADSLADQVLDASKSELRDVYAIGLRTLVQRIPQRMGDPTSQQLVGRLLEGIRGGDNEEIVLSCLDILTDLLTRFGSTAVAMTRQHEPILQMCLHQIHTSQTAAVRKRVGTTIGCLSVVLGDTLLVSMVERLLGQLQEEDENNRPNSNTRALIRTMCTVSGSVGHRLQQPQIDRIIPIFLKYCQPEEALTGDDNEDDENENGMEDSSAFASGDDSLMQDEAAMAMANELRESCFMGFESFVLRCPTQVRPHLEQIIQSALAYMSYDPNYSYGTDEENTEMGDEDGNDDDEDEMDYDDDQDEYSEEEEDDDDDDDDESWKVRRSAIRALKAVVECQKHDPSLLWTKEFPTRRGKSAILAMALVQRFKEREENCRVGVLDCFTRLLDVTVKAADTGVIIIQESQMETSTIPTIDLRSKYTPALVAACEKLLSVKKGGERSKSHALLLLSTLCLAPGGVGGESEIESVFAHIQSFLSSGEKGKDFHRESSSKTLRLDALSLVHAMLSCNNHNPINIRKGLQKSLLPQLCEAVQEQWYKVIAEALRAIAAVPRFFIVGYDEEETDEATISAERKEVASQLFTAIEPLLSAFDVDQEIKECALTACAALLSELFSSLSNDQTTRLLNLLLDRLNNETTRMVAIKTLSTISSSKINLTPILAESIKTLAGFLKMQARSLKQAALQGLDTMLTNHGVSDAKDLYATVLQELSPLIVDLDLHISHLAMRTSISVLKVCPSCGPAAKKYVSPRALTLSSSPLLQDLALESLLALLEQLVKSGSMEFGEMLAMLRQNLSQVGNSKHAIENLARCIAVITAATSHENRLTVVSETLLALDGSPTPEDTSKLKEVQLSLLLSGDLGRIVDLRTTKDGAAEAFLAIYMGYFESSSEDLKNSAAYALGRAAVGAQAVFLPAIVQALGKNSQKKQYLLLSALRAFIQCSFQQSGGDGVASSLPVIIPHLETHCSDAEEGVRTMVAECMGSLTCMQPSKMLPKLCGFMEDHFEIEAPNGTIDSADTKSKSNALVCWTVATSVKLAIAGKANPTEMSTYMPRLLKILNQKEISCRHAGLLMAYSAAHHMPQVVSGLMKDLIMPTLYEVATFKLQRKVDLGPFTHTVDDALPLRKTTLSIFASCLDNFPASLDTGAFLPVLATALGDVEDIQLQAHQIVISMCTRQPTFVVNAVDTFVEPLEKTMHKKAGQKAGTELERHHEWIKSALRTMVALSKLEGAMVNRKFVDFVSRIRANSKFEPMLKAIAEES